MTNPKKEKKVQKEKKEKKEVKEKKVKKIQKEKEGGKSNKKKGGGLAASKIAKGVVEPTYDRLGMTEYVSASGERLSPRNPQESQGSYFDSVLKLDIAPTSPQVLPTTPVSTARAAGLASRSTPRVIRTPPPFVPNATPIFTSRDTVVLEPSVEGSSHSASPIPLPDMLSNTSSPAQPAVSSSVSSSPLPMPPPLPSSARPAAEPVVASSVIRPTVNMPPPLMPQMYQVPPNYTPPMMQSPPYYGLPQVPRMSQMPYNMMQIPYQAGWWNSNNSYVQKPNLRTPKHNTYGIMDHTTYKNLPGVTPLQRRLGGSKKKVKYVKYKTKEILGKKRQIYRKKDKKSKKDYIKYKKDYITVNEYIKLAKKKKSKKN